MQRLEITLPEELREFVEAEAARGGYERPRAYVESLLRRAAEEHAAQSAESEQLEALLLEGLRSGPSTEMTAADWRSIRDEVQARLAVRQPA